MGAAVLGTGALLALGAVASTFAGGWALARGQQTAGMLMLLAAVLAWGWAATLAFLAGIAWRRTSAVGAAATREPPSPSDPTATLSPNLAPNLAPSSATPVASSLASSCAAVVAAPAMAHRVASTASPPRAVTAASDSVAGAATAPSPSPVWSAEEAEALAYTLSHDLRAPLRVIEGFGGFLKEDHGAVLGKVGNDHLDRMLGAATRMGQMIDTLMALSRLSTQALARETVDLSRMAETVVTELRATTPGREVQVQIEPGLRAQGDPTLLRMVLDNLLGNAWKYTARTPHAVIRLAQCDAAGAEARSMPPRARGQMVFEVSDNGAGFDMQFAQRLFRAFQRLHSASEFPGHGVGLASVQRVVRRHGGEVWAESAVGQGARFYFSLGQAATPG